MFSIIPSIRINKPKIKNNKIQTVHGSHSLEDAIQRINLEWKNQPYFIAVDIGASNVRFAFENLKTEEIIHVHKKLCKSMDLLKQDFSMMLALQKPAIAACLALAGPIKKEFVEITNYEKGKKRLYRNDLPSSVFPVGSTYFLNDVASCGYGILSEGLQGNLHAFFDHPKGKEYVKLEDNSFVVLAVGTGLGSAILEYSALSKSYQLIPMELGHIFVSFSKNPDLLNFFHFLSKETTEGNFPPKIESICSGKGLELCYEYLIVSKNLSVDSLRASEIAVQALNDESLATEAMKLHYRILYETAQLLSIQFPNVCKVFLAGDNQVFNEPFLCRHQQYFDEIFYQNHPLAEWLADIQIYRQIERQNFNLTGALYFCHLSR